MRNIMTNVLIVDDHQIVIDGLKLLLSNIPDIKIIGTANSGSEALGFLEHNAVELVLLDLYMPEMNGIEVCESMIQKFPDLKILALTTANETSLIRKMFSVGAKGYLMKNTDINELIEAIDTVMNGDTFFGAEVSKSILSEMSGKPKKSSDSIPKLSRREKQILQLIIDEMTTAEIADKLFITFGTVETHRRNIMNKLGARNTAGMVRITMENDLLK